MLSEDPVRTSRTISTSRSSGKQGSRRRSRARIHFLLAGLVIVAAIGYMIYAATQSGSEYFITTSELKAMGAKAIDQPIQLGGRVVQGSIQRDKGSNTLAFQLTDGTQTVPVTYKGVVPDSFQEGVDVIVEGKLGANGGFQATSLLAKCASKYVPATSK